MIENVLPLKTDLERALDEIVEVPKYPLEKLGPILSDAAYQLASSVQAPIEIAAHSILAAASFATQDKANILIDGRTIPLSLFCLTVAESGDRKSACDTIAMKPVEEWQKELVADYENDQCTYLNNKDIFEAEKRSIVASKSLDLSTKTMQLEDLTPPQKPVQPFCLCTEPTLEGLYKSFTQGRPSQGLFSDEGAQFFGGHAMKPENCAKTISGLSKFWDGSPISRMRASEGESILLFNRRLSLHLLVQPVIAENVLSDALLKEQGLLARFLIAQSQTIAGTRLYKETNPHEIPAIIKFHQRIDKLIRQQITQDEQGGILFQTLELTPAAKKIWKIGYNNIELQLSPGETLDSVKPLASKAAENALRLAGVVAVFNGDEAIDKTHIENAYGLIHYYLSAASYEEQKRALQVREKKAQEMLSWLKKRPEREADSATIQKTVVPAYLRKSIGNIRAVMRDLVEANKVEMIELNRDDRPCKWRVRDET